MKLEFEILKDFFYIKDKKNYSVGGVIELTKEDAQNMVKYGYLKENKEPYSKSKEGTKGITSKKTIEEADAEIKAENSKL